MSPDPKHNQDCCNIIAGGWTYYQWDKVLFPKENANLQSRLADERVDLSLMFNDVVISVLGNPRLDFPSGGDLFKKIEVADARFNARELLIVEMRGAILVENCRSFPVDLKLKGQNLTINHGIELEEISPMRVLTFLEAETSEIENIDPFDGVIKGGLVLESGGTAKLGFRVPFIVQSALIEKTHEIVFSAEFEITKIDALSSDRVVENSKSKLVYAAALFAGGTHQNLIKPGEVRSDASLQLQAIIGGQSHEDIVSKPVDRPESDLDTDAGRNPTVGSAPR